MALAILYEDEHCLAVVKPPGQFTQGSWAPPGEITLETAVRQYLDPGDPGSAYLGIVHRLDRPTSGLLIWAKTPKAARRLSSQFERRRVVKEYWAIVESNAPPTNRFNPSEDTWTDWLTHADARGVVSVVAARSAGAREAITTVRFEACKSLSPPLLWLRLWPQTGRTHQLRAQASSRGLPILGDIAYGSMIPTAIAPSIALHARSLSVRHPITGTEMTLIAPVPSTWGDAGIALAADRSDERTKRNDERGG